MSTQFTPYSSHKVDNLLETPFRHPVDFVVRSYRRPPEFSRQNRKVRNYIGVDTLYSLPEDTGLLVSLE